MVLLNAEDPNSPFARRIWKTVPKEVENIYHNTQLIPLGITLLRVH